MLWRLSHPVLLARAFRSGAFAGFAGKAAAAGLFGTSV
jgi:hypothetical protein